ncbi:MAG: response regulator [Lachnospiraceae bacterium]|nr:response regulator [Lachnospiraceae bacterium]
MNLATPVILVVDDNDINRMIISQIIQKIGFVPEEYDCGEASIERVEAGKRGEKQSVNLIIMDYLMPSMNGDVATSVIRSMELDVQPAIIGFTGANSDEKELLLNSGMDTVLFKPVSYETLEKTLHEYLPQYFFENSIKSTEVEKTMQILHDVTSEEETIHAVKESAFSFNEAQKLLFDTLSSSGLEMNIEEGLKLCLGKTDNFVKVLRSTLKSFEDFSSQMLNCDNSHEDYRRCVHSLKSLFNNIGALEIAGKFAMTEDYVKTNMQLPDFDTQEELIAILDAYSTLFRKAFVLYDNENEGIGNEDFTEISEEEFFDIKSEIVEGIVNFMIDDAMAAITRLKEYCNAGRKKVLKEAACLLDNFDYDGAKQKILEL